MQTSRLVLSTLLTWLFCGWVMAAPSITNLSDNRSSYTNSQVPRYEKFEMTFDLSASFTNFADPAQVNVRCVFTAPSAAQLTQPGFLYEQYTRSGDASNEIVDVVPGSRKWKIRFAPRETGTYTYTLYATDSSGTTSTTGSFVATSALSGQKGFLKRNGNQLQFDDGSPYYGIGTNSPWFQPSFWGGGTYGADDNYGRQYTNGGNWDRLWIDVGDWASPSIMAQRTFWNFWTSDSSASRDTTAGVAHSGIVAAKITTTADQTTDRRVSWSKTQNWQLTQGQQYTFSCWIKTTSVSAASGGGAFVSGNGVTSCPATPVTGTTNWTQYTTTFTAGSTGRFSPQIHLKNATGTVWFDDLSLKKVGDPTELGEDIGFERGVYQSGIINLDEAWKLDYVLDLARQKGVYVMLMCGHNQDDLQKHKDYMRYLIARWGYNTAVAAWEMCNENCFATQRTIDWSDYVEATDPYRHLMTTSFWNMAVDYAIWSLPKIDVVQMHRYIIDSGGGTVWALNGNAAWDTSTKHHGNRSVKIVANGGNAGYVNYTAAARPGSYIWKFYVKGNNVAQSNWTAPAGIIKFYDKDGTQLSMTPSDADSNSTALNGTYDWKLMTYNVTAPANTAKVTITARGGYLAAGAELWFDELSLTDPDGFEVTTDYSMEVTDYYDDLAMVLNREARSMLGGAWNRPMWWGELGLEDHNEPQGEFWESPYHDADSTGIIMHQVLWGSVASGAQSTGEWWYNKADYSHFTAVKNFMNAVGALPSDMRGVSYLDPSPKVTASNSNIRIHALKNATRAVAYIYHKDYTWARKLRDGVTPTGISGASVTINGLDNGQYEVKWWSPQTGSQVGTTSYSNASGNVLTLSLPQTLSNDLALFVKSTGATAPAAPSGLSATAASSSQINLSWTDNASNESGFKIERKTGSGGTYSQIDTVGANVTSYQSTGLGASTQYYYRVRAYNTAGDSAYSNEANATTQSAGTGAFQQDSGSDGIVSMEAENYTSKVDDVASHSWTSFTDANASNGGGMQSMPDSGANVNTGYTTGSPVMNYQVNFTKTGTHYVWVRATGANASADSLHAGLDGAAIASCDRIQTTGNNALSWTKDTMDGVVATFNVSSTGLHTVNIYMREDGCKVDKIVLTTNSSYAPSGTGPAESPRSGGSAPSAPSSLSATAASSSQINLSWTDNASDETGFKIERKTGSGGTYSQIDTVGANVTSYQNTGLGASTQYYYRVRAYNTYGNSSYSNEANATTQSGGPQTVTLSASGDTQLRNNSANNYGATTTLLAKTDIVTVIRFDCSSIPSGATITSAKLALKASQDTAGGTISAYAILSGNAAWQEGAKNGAAAGSGEPNWAYRNAGTSTAWAGSGGLSTAGTDYNATAESSLSGPYASGTRYEWTLGTSLVSGWVNNSTTNHGLVLRAATGYWPTFHSKEATNAADRPQLIVTYQQ